MENTNLVPRSENMAAIRKINDFEMPARDADGADRSAPCWSALKGTVCRTIKQPFVDLYQASALVGAKIDHVSDLLSRPLPSAIAGRLLRADIKDELVDQRVYQDLFFKDNTFAGCYDSFNFIRLGALAVIRNKGKHAQGTCIGVQEILRTSGTPAIASIMALRSLMKRILDNPETRDEAIRRCGHALRVLNEIYNMPANGPIQFTDRRWVCDETANLIRGCEQVLRNPALGHYVLTNPEDAVRWRLVAQRALSLAVIVGVFVGLRKI